MRMFITLAVSCIIILGGQMLMFGNIITTNSLPLTIIMYFLLSIIFASSLLPTSKETLDYMEAMQRMDK